MTKRAAAQMPGGWDDMDVLVVVAGRIAFRSGVRFEQARAIAATCAPHVTLARSSDGTVTIDSDDVSFSEMVGLWAAILAAARDNFRQLELAELEAQK